jgi:hypothetical protein
MPMKKDVVRLVRALVIVLISVVVLGHLGAPAKLQLWAQEIDNSVREIEAKHCRSLKGELYYDCWGAWSQKYVK